MLYVYFSFAADAPALSMSVARLREVAGDAVEIAVVNDAAAPIPAEQLPPRVIHCMSRYDRGETGKGLPAVRGQLTALRDLMTATGEDYAIKIDSDVWVNDISLFEVERDGTPPADMLALEGSRALLPMGCAYRVSKWAVDAALKLMDERDKLGWQPGTYAEALTLWHLLTLTRLPLHLIPSALGYLTGFHLDDRSQVPESVLTAGIIHCGEPYPDGKDLHRAPRELTRTRFSLLRHLHK